MAVDTAASAVDLPIFRRYILTDGLLLRVRA